MPLPPAPTQRASLISSKALAKTESAVSAPVKSMPHDNVTKKPIAKKAMTVSQEQAISTSSSSREPVPQQAPKKIKSSKKNQGPTKLFVLDTNVLMHDPMCLFQFEEHDVYLPMIVLEELDSHKKGMTEVARNARQTSRFLDALAAIPGSDIQLGLPLNATGHIDSGGKLFFQTQNRFVTGLLFEQRHGVKSLKTERQIIASS